MPRRPPDAIRVRSIDGADLVDRGRGRCSCSGGRKTTAPVREFVTQVPPFVAQPPAPDAKLPASTRSCTATRARDSIAGGRHRLAAERTSSLRGSRARAPDRGRDTAWGSLAGQDPQCVVDRDRHTFHARRCGDRLGLQRTPQAPRPAAGQDAGVQSTALHSSSMIRSPCHFGVHRMAEAFARRLAIDWTRGGADACDGRLPQQRARPRRELEHREAHRAGDLGGVAAVDLDVGVGVVVRVGVARRGRSGGWGRSPR